MLIMLKLTQSTTRNYVIKNRSMFRTLDTGRHKTLNAKAREDKAQNHYPGRLLVREKTERQELAKSKAKIRPLRRQLRNQNRVSWQKCCFLSQSQKEENRWQDLFQKKATASWLYLKYYNTLKVPVTRKVNSAKGMVLLTLPEENDYHLLWILERK